MTHTKKPQEQSGLADTRLIFPPEMIVGTIGELARQLALGTEVPEEFYFAAGLAVFGATCSPALTVNVSGEGDKRFYTVLFGDSYSVKERTAVRNTIEFFS